MRKTSESRSRRLLTALGALGGSVLLSACSSPLAPAPVEIRVAPAGDEAGGVSASVARGPNFGPCRYCPPSEMDPERIGPNMPIDFLFSMGNTGDAPAGIVHVSVSLLGADGRRRPAAEADIAAPRPGEIVSQRLRLVVPSETPAGSYRLEVVIDPDNRIAESNESDNTWFSEGILTVG